MDWLERSLRQRMKQLWPEITVPLSLADILKTMTKNDLDKIRLNLDVERISHLRKQELAAALMAAIPEKVSKIFFLMDQELYDFIKKIAASGGYIAADEGLTLSLVEYFRGHGMLFTGVYQNQEILAMPAEVLAVFNQVDGPKLAQVVKYNTQVIYLTHGLLYYYGVLSITRLVTMLEDRLNISLSYKEFFDLIENAVKVYRRVMLWRGGYRYVCVDDPEAVQSEQQKRPDINYYPFTNEELLQAGRPGYIEHTPQKAAFIKFLLANYELTADEAEDIAAVCVNFIRNTGDIMSALHYLEDCLEQPDLATIQQLADLLVQLHNNTRQWILKGYTPIALHRRRQRHHTCRW